jgi:cytochrome P450
MPTATLNQKTIPSLPVKGLFGLGFAREILANRLSFFTSSQEIYGPIVRFKIGPISAVYVSANDLISEVLSEKASYFLKGATERSLHKVVTGTALNVTNGEYHQKQRKLLAPAFSIQQMSGYTKTIVANTEASCLEWVTAHELNLEQALHALTLRIAGDIFLSKQDFNPSDPLWNAIKTCVDYLDYKATHVLPLPLWLPTPLNLKTKASIAEFDKQIQQAMAAKPAGNDLLGVLMRMRYDDASGMSATQIRDELAATMITAAYDNIAQTLSWTFYLLTQNPEIYAQVLEEVDTVTLVDPQLNPESLEKLGYLKQVVKEATRLYATVSIITRQVAENVQIVGADGSNYQLYKGETIMMSPLAMQRNPDYFPNPSHFDPSRFSPENERKLPHNAYLAFGAGIHSCIGYRFALMETVLILATLSQHLTLKLVPDQKLSLVPKYFLRAAPSLKMYVHPR